MHRSFLGAAGATFRCCGYLDSPGSLTLRPSLASYVTVLRKTTSAAPMAYWQFQRCSVSALLQCHRLCSAFKSTCAHRRRSTQKVQAGQSLAMHANADVQLSSGAVHPRQMSQHIRGLPVQMLLAPVHGGPPISGPAVALNCKLQAETTSRSSALNQLPCVRQEGEWNPTQQWHFWIEAAMKARELPSKVIARLGWAGVAVHARPGAKALKGMLQTQACHPGSWVGC